MSLRVPPPEIPVVTFLSPNKNDQGLIEFWNSEVASYTPLDIGAPHPNTRQYPGFTLGKQAPVQGDEKWVIRTWITPETNPDWFNYAEKYSAEDNAYPIFIRTYREPKETYTPRAKQSTLGTLYKLVVEDHGSGYAQGALPAIKFDLQVPAPDSVAIGHGVVAPDGSISECVLDFGGEGYVENISFTVEDPLNGTPASGTAYVQSQGAILVKEEANLYPPDSEFYAQYLQVVRIYETLPGPTLYSTKLDIDGVTLTTGVTRKLCADITTGEDINGGVWARTTKRPTDIDFVCEEVVETRAIPGIPMVTTRVEEDGKITTITKTLGESSGIVSQEVITGGYWVQTHKEDVDGTSLISWQVIESRPVPGNAIPYTRLDEDGKTVSGTRTLKDESTITTIENITGGVWTHTFKEKVTDLVSWQVTESRPVPGNPIVEEKINDDGKRIPVVRTLKDVTTITPSETITGGNWVKKETKSVSDLVAWELVTSQPVPGNNVPSANITADHEVSTTQRLFRDQSLITPSATESGGFITTVEKKEVSDLVADQITTVTQWLDKAEYAISIINLIPREFMAFVPTFTESHILSGTASMPTLGAGEFEHSKRQLTKLLYEERIVSLGSVSLPITHTNQETTEEYGGGVLNVTYVLATQGTGTIDEGLLVTDSTLTDLGNGMEVKLTKELDDTAWPVLYSRLWDENFRVEYDETRQVVDAGTSEDPDPGGGFAWLSEVKAIDKWRSVIINTAKPSPAYTDEASALISYAYKPFRFPGLVYYQPASIGYYVRSADATLVQHLVKTWWIKSSTTPTVGATGSGADVEVDEIILDDPIINALNNTSQITYAGPTLHDDLTIGNLFYPATTPSYTEYALGTPSGSTLHNIASLYSPGSTGGYSVGDLLTITGAGTMQVTVTFVYDVPGGSTGLIGATTADDPGGSFPAGVYGPIAASGGGGTGAYFNVWAVEVPGYTPGTQWIGTYRVIGAEVKPEREKDIWKVVTESVVMH